MPRSANREATVPMYRCRNPEDFETLIKCTEDSLDGKNIRVVMEVFEQMALNRPIEHPERVHVRELMRLQYWPEQRVYECGEAMQIPGKQNANGWWREVVEELIDSDEDTNLPGRVFVEKFE